MSKNDEELKCNSCKHKSGYVSGFDEYPPNTFLEHCNKNHWDFSDIEPEPDETNDFRENCVDYELKQTDK